jgi:hypothetical protein
VLEEEIQSCTTPGGFLPLKKNLCKTKILFAFFPKKHKEYKYVRVSGPSTSLDMVMQRRKQFLDLGFLPPNDLKRFTR